PPRQRARRRRTRREGGGGSGWPSATPSCRGGGVEPDDRSRRAVGTRDGWRSGRRTRTRIERRTIARRRIDLTRRKRRVATAGGAATGRTPQTGSRRSGKLHEERGIDAAAVLHGARRPFHGLGPGLERERPRPLAGGRPAGAQ